MREIKSNIVNVRGESTPEEIRRIPSASYALPYVFVLLWGKTLHTWVLRPKTTDESDDGEGLLVPDDYDRETNNVIFARQ